MPAPGKPLPATLAEVEAALHELWIARAGTALRDEERQKARELVPLLGEIARALGARGRRPVVVDAAAGKSYVGLLVARFVLQGRGGRVIVIEREPRHHGAASVALARLAPPVAVAHATGDGVEVEVRPGDVADAALWPEAPDLVVGLHACGPASDAILDRAVAARARRLLLVPCCTGRAVPAFALADALADRLGLPEQAGVRAPFREVVVSSERVLRLEAAGYRVEMVPFVPPTVTPYNLVLRALRVGEPGRARAAAASLSRLRAAADRDG